MFFIKKDYTFATKRNMPKIDSPSISLIDFELEYKHNTNMSYQDLPLKDNLFYLHRIVKYKWGNAFYFFNNQNVSTIPYIKEYKII